MSAEVGFWEVVGKRGSIRRYKEQEVAQKLIEHILGAALSAPSAHNLQPWRFIVLTAPEKKYALARAMAAKLAMDLREEGIPFSQRVRKLRRSLKLFSRAPVIIIPFLMGSNVRKDRNEEQERVMAVQSVALAVGQLLLAATAEGLGACWYAAPLFCPAVIRQQLELTEDWEPQALITMGYPDEQSADKKRKKLEDVCVIL